MSQYLLHSFSFRQQSFFLVFIGVVFYFNSFFNKYALDDNSVIRLNDYVHQGFAGIPQILSSDAYDSFFKSMSSVSQLKGGRYRPLSLITFAIEQQLFGECYGARYMQVKDSIALLRKNPSLYINKLNLLIVERRIIEGNLSETYQSMAFIRHVVNVLLYILSVFLLFDLLHNYLLPSLSLKVHYVDFSFLTSLLFLIHPIHVEVVANIKSRDEILSFLFIVLTLRYSFQYAQLRQVKHLLIGSLCYVLALLSKEWSITLIALIPMMLYVFNRFSMADSIKASLPFILVALLYLLVRYEIVGVGQTANSNDIINNPFLYATPVQAMATKIFVLLKYLYLLVIPYSLSADYSYNTIPYKSFADFLVWISLFVNAIILFLFFYFLRKRHWLAFVIGFYLLHLMLVSNFILPLGATMGERLIYHSSLGYVMVLSYLFLYVVEKIKLPDGEKRNVTSISVLLLVVASGLIVIPRNANWKTTDTLFLHDVKVVPNSVMANGNAGVAYTESIVGSRDTAWRRAQLNAALVYLNRAITIEPKFVNGYLNLGWTYFQLDDLEKAEFYWSRARKMYPDHPYFKEVFDPALSDALVDRAKEEVKVRNMPLAHKYITQALRYDSLNAETWHHYGGINSLMGNVQGAYMGWSKCVQLNPHHPLAGKCLDALVKQMEKHQLTIAPASVNVKK